MKVCPYCGKEVGNRIYNIDDFELFENADYVDKDGRYGYYADYIVTCPNCNGEFYWTELFLRVSTIITDANTDEGVVYKEQRE